MKITEGMVTVFNMELEKLNCSFRLCYKQGGLSGNPTCEIVPANDLFIESHIINLSSAFYEKLDAFFKERGVELSYNNTGHIFWSANYWDEIAEEMLEKNKTEEKGA